MSKINKQFKTAYTADEMKNWVSSTILPHPMIGSMINSSQWNNYSLFLDTKVGTGNIHLKDNYVEVDFDLNMFGSMASRAIEEALDTEFKKLEVRNQ